MPRAVILSTILIGALYIFTTYAATVYFGLEKFSGFAAYANGVPWDGLARSVSVVFWALVLFAIINSTLANANAGANVFTRTAYAFGRVGAFPRWFADLHPKYKSPRVGLLVELLLSLTVGLALGFKYTPQVAFGIIGTALVVIVVPVYIATNIACIGFFARHRKEEQHWVLHIIVPVIGALLLIPGFFSVAGITGVPGLRFISALTSPYKYAPYVMAAWLVFGIAILVRSVRGGRRRSTRWLTSTSKTRACKNAKGRAACAAPAPTLPACEERPRGFCRRAQLAATVSLRKVGMLRTPISAMNASRTLRGSSSG